MQLYWRGRKALKEESKEDREQWSMDNVQRVKKRKEYLKPDEYHGNQFYSDHSDHEQPKNTAVQYSKYPANNHKTNGCHGNQVDAFHSDRSNVSQESQGRDFGPVYGVEDKRDGIWSSLLETK